MTGAHTLDIAVIAGDGIGREVVPAAMDVVDRAGELFGFDVTWTPYPWGCDYFVAHGRMMPVDGLDQLARHDAIFFGAVGRPDVPDHVSLWGLLIPMRRAFDQFVNLRPCRPLPGVTGPLRHDPDQPPIDLVVVRENTEGEYSEIGGRAHSGSEAEMALQTAVFTRRGIERVVRYAFELARSRRQRLVGATKSNGITHTMPFWDQVFGEIADDYADVDWRLMHVDALAAAVITRPHAFDVIVASNLFGDVLSEIGAAVTGSIGTAPSANLDPTRRHPSMFEPIHGSAPDIAGTGTANPVGQIWSAALMLAHLRQPVAATAIEVALEAALADPSMRTPDLGGHRGTEEVARAVRDALRRD